MEKKLDGYSMDLEKINKERLKSVFPECFVEDKLDINKLLSLCGEYITNDFEKYSFEWKGKSECLQLAQKRSSGTLRPYPEESVDFNNTNNIYIEGDNLEVLKLLQTSYFRKVKMIYIDPPYNTGNDFVYEDDYKEPLQKYKEITSQCVKSNPESMGRYHTNWLNMMYPRLILASNLLRDDGVIFISIDDNEVDNLKKLCNEVFGEENFVACIIWEKSYAPINLKKHFSENHDFILCYAKNLDDLVCNGLIKNDETLSRYKNLDNDPRGLWQSDNLSVGPVIQEKVYEITTPSGKKFLPPKGRCWVLTEERFKEYVKDNRIWFGEGGDNVPRIKRFLSEVKNTITPMTIWKYSEVGHTQDATKNLKELFDDKAVFNYSKTVPLIKRMIELYTNKNANDIILDFFSGSGTTAHAVMQLNAEDGGNRQFIMVQLPEVCDKNNEAYKAGYKNICEIGKERIRRAGQKILGENTQLKLEEKATSIDVGFKVFKLDTSNIYEWDSTPIDEKEITLFHQRIMDMMNGIKPDRIDLDVLYEIMLKMGVQMNTPIFQVEINNKKFYSIGKDYEILAYFENKIIPEDIEAIKQYSPTCLIMSEAGFLDDSVLANAYFILKNTGIELKLI